MYIDTLIALALLALMLAASVVWIWTLIDCATKEDSAGNDMRVPPAENPMAHPAGHRDPWPRCISSK